CALLYIIENGCKWRALPKKYGNWHSVYMKFSRWSKNGTIQKIFDEMQKMGLIKTDTDVLCIDSTSIKVHPDATGARKSNGNQDIGRWDGADNKTPSLLYLRTVRVCISSACREPPRSCRRQKADWRHLF
ncbi:MAG: transposase, partial [Turicibacter sp.]|nr:transposase [Turicibacter sp.]